MASRAIYGKPGGGKSYWTTARVILDEILTTDRVIVTNVVLRIDAWVPYLVKIGRPEIAFHERVLLIGDDNVRLNGALYGDEDVKNFWRFRGVDQILPALTDEQIKEGVRPEIEPGRGVHYVLDELHEHLNSRQWMKTGALLLWYIAKHRHYGDDVTWITQSVANVDKQFRSVTQDYTLVRNYGKEKFRGFRKGNKFQAVTFLDYDPGEKLTPQSSETFKLDLEIANLYHTSVKGGDADKGEKVKGLHVYWIYAAVVALVVAVAVGFMVVPEWAAKRIASKGGKKPAEEIGRLAVSGTVPRGAVKAGAPLDTPKIGEDIVHVVGVPLVHVTADRVLAALGAETTGGPSVVASANNAALIVSGTSLQAVASVAESVRQYDSAGAVITVEAVVCRLVKGRGARYGLYDFLRSAALSDSGGFGRLLESLQWDAAVGVVTFGTVPAARYALQMITDFESSGYRFEVVSRPALSVLAGNSAEFASGREIPVPVTVSNDAGTQTSIEYKQAEFAFVVTPTLLPGGMVRLLLDQRNSDVLGTAQVGGNATPTLSTQRLRTYVDLRPGQVGYLGGLTYQTKRRDRRAVPVLGDIPGLNLIFATKDNGEESGELVLFVTVSHASDGAGPAVRRAVPVSYPTPGGAWIDDMSTLSAMPQAGTGQGQQTNGAKKLK